MPINTRIQIAKKKNKSNSFCEHIIGDNDRYTGGGMFDSCVWSILWVRCNVEKTKNEMERDAENLSKL